MTEQDKKYVYVVEVLLPLVYTEWNQRIRHHETRLVQMLALSATTLLGLILLSDRLGLLTYWSLLPIGFSLVPIVYNLIKCLHDGRLVVHQPATFLQTAWRNASMPEFLCALIQSTEKDDEYVTNRLEVLAGNVKLTARLLGLSGLVWAIYLVVMVVASSID